MNAPVWSPCIKVCLVDPEGRICVGCYRTLEELGRWTKMSDSEREALKPTLEARRAAYQAKRA